MSPSASLSRQVCQGRTCNGGWLFSYLTLTGPLVMMTALWPGGVVARSDNTDCRVRLYWPRIFSMTKSVLCSTHRAWDRLQKLAMFGLLSWAVFFTVLVVLSLSPPPTYPPNWPPPIYYHDSLLISFPGATGLLHLAWHDSDPIIYDWPQCQQSLIELLSTRIGNGEKRPNAK